MVKKNNSFELFATLYSTVFDFTGKILDSYQYLIETCDCAELTPDELLLVERWLESLKASKQHLNQGQR